jgi:hypothetical protein
VDVERDNLEQIAQLNQRGGPALSIIDLIEDGTVTAEMAAFCWQAVAGGAGFLTGAVPGGAGKTTLMAAVLAFLPPGERIITVSDRSVLDAALAGRVGRPATLLAHEIGAGRWFGYIWGRDAADFFSLGARGLRTVTCLHADTAEQAWDILAPLGVKRGHFDGVRLQLFLQVPTRAGRVLHRVRWIYFRVDGALRPVYAWRRDGDRSESLMDRPALCRALADAASTLPEDEDAAWRERQSLLEALHRDGVSLYEDVRARLVAAS